MTSPQPSSRFRRAARAERDRLERQRQKLEAEVSRLESALAEAQEKLRALSDRIGTLASIVGVPAAREAAEPPTISTDQHLLQGAEIRETAVKVLVDSGRHGPIHYREWHALVEREGYAIAGKRPDAVFLSQISRSPVVRASTKAGLYEIDQAAPQRLRHRLDGLQKQLLEATSSIPVDAADVAARGKRQRQLTVDIARTQRELEEALRVLESASSDSETRLAA